MSAASENSLEDSSKSASVEVQDGDQPSGPGSSAAGTAKAPEKTISCVSCRKRKLKCDRVKPTCGTCTRLRHECEFPERRRNLGTKRRNIKELEARLAQVETQLISESKQTASTHATAVPGGQTDWNNLGMDMNLDLDDDGLLDPSFDISQPAFGFSAPVPEPNMMDGNFGSYDLIGLGLQEPLPPQQMMDELHHIYFEKHHPTIPMMHKLRYYASLDRAPHMRPPICLRYAMWTMAASLCPEKYSSFEGIFYERARRYIQDAEMKGQGEVFVSVYYAQAWSLIATYEASKTYFTRAWLSVGRATRLAQMLGLHRLDVEDPSAKNILPPPKDFIEAEERRRTFWATFYGDRWASSGTGWPMVIVESDITTNLPTSEESFENGTEEKSISLEEAFTTEGASKISSFAGVIISATLFGHNYQHLHAKGPAERPEDLANGEFWKRHRKMDNVLSNTFMFLPDNLRLPANARDTNVVFIHMNIHASCICLHQAAVLTAKKHNIDPNFIQQSRNRNLMAAEEITNTMRLISHMDSSHMNSWMGFCLFVAGGIFIQDLKSDRRRPQSVANLEFLLLAMRAIGVRHPITNHFTAQLELDMVAAGVKDAAPFPCPMPVLEKHDARNNPTSEIFADQRDRPITIEDLASSTPGSSGPVTFTQVIENLTHQDTAAGFHKPGNGDHNTRTFLHPAVPYFVREMNRREEELNTDQTVSTGSNGGRTDSILARATQNLGENGFHASSDAFSRFDEVPAAPVGDTPSSDSSSTNMMQGTSTTALPNSNTTQYPFRTIEPSNRSTKSFFIFQTDPSSYQHSPEWGMQDTIPGFNDSGQGGNGLEHDFSGFDNNGQPGVEFHDFIGDSPWNNGPLPE